MKKGQTFKIKHSDGIIITEVVDIVKNIRELKAVNVYHHIRKNSIIHTYSEVLKTTLVVCESCAVYDLKEIV